MARLKCTRCGYIGPLEKFKKEKRNRVGRTKLCKICDNRAGAEYVKNNYARVSKRGREYCKSRYYKIKNAVFDYYGWNCVWCGEDDRMAMSLDHKLNDGNKHRRSLKAKSSISVYRDVINRGFPKTFQTLCANCNIVKHKLGGKMPPHRKNKYK